MYSLRRMGLRDGGGIIMLMSYLWRGEIFHSNNWLNAMVKNCKAYSVLTKSMDLYLRTVLFFAFCECCFFVLIFLTIYYFKP